MNPSLKGLLNDFSDALSQIRAKAAKGRFAIDVITSDYCCHLDDEENLKNLSREFHRFRNLAEIAFDYTSLRRKKIFSAFKRLLTRAFRRKERRQPMKTVEVALPECPLIDSFVAKGTYYINTCFAPAQPSPARGAETADMKGTLIPLLEKANDRELRLVYWFLKGLTAQRTTEERME